MKTGSEDERVELPLIEGFPPILGHAPEILILGSMPSVRSLEKREYYGHPRNRFWPLMLELLVGREDGLPYVERTTLIKSSGIAIWDSIASCRRNGSLDSEIAEARPNPVDRFIEVNSSIKWVLFNGKAAEKVFWKAFPSMRKKMGGLNFLSLPSTSPANASWSFERLQEVWGQALRNAGLKVPKRGPQP